MATSSTIVLSRSQIGLLLSCQLSLIALLMANLSLSLVAIMTLCILWHVLLHIRKAAMPASWLVQLVAAVCCVLLLVLGPQLGLLIAMVHLMAFSYVLKAIQIRQQRDLNLVVIQGYFLMASVFIFSQEMLTVFAVVALFIANTAILAMPYLALQGIRNALQFAFKLTVVSIPLAIVLFVFFPKLAPFWQMPIANSARTGLSESVQPGDIANLARSDELAFRVEFNGASPTHAQRYWRAIVLDRFDGEKWTVSPYLKELDRQITLGRFTADSVALNADFSYKVTAQPSYQQWLFNLGRPSSTTSGVRVVPTGRLLKQSPLTQPFVYQVNSQAILSMPTDTLSGFWRGQYLAFPTDSNPRLAAFAQQLRAQSQNEQAFVAQILSHIRNNPFSYTLQPSLLGQNSLDMFFFQTQAGFCEHYASSVAFMLRAAGIPSRLVTGYLGGEYNNDGGYFSVFQYDAHAWLEYWHESLGWQRVDPTAAVSPARINQGLNSALADEFNLLAGGGLRLSQYRHIAFINALRQQLDLLDYQWTKWVLNYDHEQQVGLLKRLFGKGHQWKNSLLIAIALLISLSLAWLWIRRQPRVKQPAYMRAVTKLIRWLSRRQLPRQPGMTIHEYCQWLAQECPQIKAPLQQLNWAFNQLTYADNISVEQSKKLEMTIYQAIKTIKKNCPIKLPLNHIVA